MSIVLLIACIVVVTLIDWIAVLRDWGRVEEVAKPLVMLLLLVVTLESLDGAQRTAVAAAVVFGLLGDVALLNRIDAFIAGLGAFLVGHLLYVAGFAIEGLKPAPTAIGVVAAVVLVGALGRPIIAAVRHTPLHIPVAVYVVVIAAMVATSIGTTRWVAAAGGVMFALSDALLGNDRFVTPRTDRRIVVMVLYHLGQFAIVGGLA
ncbi:MAG: lysoplasmalogenase [Acidimicrobiales bacterium]|nr:lysoplasmalogenase [Acidimicrobiales bacterium]